MEPQIVVAWAGVVAAMLAAAFAAVAVPFTVRAANAARNQTDLQQKIAEDARRPMPWADIRPHPEQRRMIHLFVGNSGPTVARNVRVAIGPLLGSARS